MNDKKSCENCGRSMRNCPIKMRDLQCWVSNNELWLSILPTEPGTYWWKQNKKDKYRIREVENGYFCDDNSLVSEIGGYFQGPITPKEDK